MLLRALRNHPGAAAMLAVAAFTRFFGLGWGLPEVFEEATPMRVAWDMWGWGGRGFDPNPHFFNYPSLVIYLNLAAQAVLFAVMKLAGAVDSAVDFRALYVSNKTAFVTTGRAVTACFGVATVGVIYALVYRVAGRWPAVLAALLVAVNPLHVSMSQVIAVDVPLAFFVVAALLAAVAIPARATRRRYLLAGVLAGLAASSKYTGALTLLPVLAAHVLARRSNAHARPPWMNAAWAGASAVIAFALTSPFVLLDMSTFVQHISIERYHMQAGHFGLGDGSTWGDYLRWLGGGALGWPALLLAVVALVHLAAIRRRHWALVVAAFVVPYALVVGSWSMRAERYAVPAIAPLLVLGVALLPALTRGTWMTRSGARVRALVVAVVAVAMLAPLAAAFPTYLAHHRADARSQAREWIESNIPAGSFVVTEAYGPQLYGPYMIWQLSDDVRRRVFESYASRPYYAVQELPMYQVDPERSGVFYDLSVLSMADIVVTTEAVRGRYQRDAVRFSRQVAFYHNVERNYERVADIDGKIRVYRSLTHRRPFSARGDPQPPPALQEGLQTAPGAQERFYFQLGMNYEAFNHYGAAFACYEFAFRYSLPTPVLFADVTIAMARCLGATGQGQTGVELLERVEPAAVSERDRRRIRRFREELQRTLPSP